MARKRIPEAPKPYAEVIAYRPNGVEYSRTPVSATEVRVAIGEAWRTITSDLGWMPTIRVIRADGTDITALVS